MGRKSYGTTPRQKERGNVLFLILIAVALFGALSYSATQSTRNSAGADPGEETQKINQSSFIQYSALVRSQILRMILSNKTDGSDLEFNDPTQLSNCSAGNKKCVFHPDGGSVPYILGPKEALVGNADAPWIFNGENEINGIGLTTTGDGTSTDTADIIAFLPGLTQSFCLKINDSLDIYGIPAESGIVLDAASNMVNPNGSTPTSPGAGGATIGSPTGTNVDQLDGQLFGCFEQAGQYVYYHALVDR